MNTSKSFSKMGYKIVGTKRSKSVFRGFITIAASPINQFLLAMSHHQPRLGINNIQHDHNNIEYDTSFCLSFYPFLSHINTTLLMLFHFYSLLAPHLIFMQIRINSDNPMYLEKNLTFTFHFLFP